MAIKQAATPGRPLSEAAYRTLRERVLTCKLSPGARLTERGTAAELGLGLSPVRHALTRLIQDGLVQVIPLKGYRVAPLTVRSVDDLFNVWLLLGPEIARLGVTQADPGQAAELRPGRRGRPGPRPDTRQGQHRTVHRPRRQHVRPPCRRGRQ